MAVVVQRYFLDMSEKEMAEETGAAVGTVKWMLNAARERLRGLLSERSEDERETHQRRVGKYRSLRRPENTNLWLDISAQLERKSLMQLYVQDTVYDGDCHISALLLSGVVYALGRSLGYIPGIGIVEQSVPIRVLAEPVTVEQQEFP